MAFAVASFAVAFTVASFAVAFTVASSRVAFAVASSEAAFAGRSWEQGRTVRVAFAEAREYLAFSRRHYRRLDEHLLPQAALPLAVKAPLKQAVLALATVPVLRIDLLILWCLLWEAT